MQNLQILAQKVGGTAWNKGGKVRIYFQTGAETINAFLEFRDLPCSASSREIENAVLKVFYNPIIPVTQEQRTKKALQIKRKLQQEIAYHLQESEQAEVTAMNAQAWQQPNPSLLRLAREAEAVF